MAGAVFLIAALGVENKLCRNSMKLGSRNKTDETGTGGKCIDNHHYRYRATPCRGETKGSRAFPNTRTRALEPGLMSASRGYLQFCQALVCQK